MSYVSERQTNLIQFCASVFVCLFIILASHRLAAQPQDSLAVFIQNIATNGASLRGYTASYPYPILSLINILDADNRPLRGFADTLQWLGPDDVANNSRPIQKIWQPILDYTNGQPITESANIYNLRPQPTFIEICESCPPIVPTTTMLLMDVSGSINNIPNALDSAKAGLKNFIGDMRPEDRAGVIQFYCEFKHLPPTNDKQVLIDFVESAQTGPWTPLYEAIINAIDSMKNETTIRRSIVVYTDGKNNLPRDLTKCPNVKRPLLNEDSVIVAAKKFQIPVYMIALANSASETILQKIAVETGGRFFKTVDGGNFSEIYKKISDIIQNFYVMAHISPQPCESDFTRIVEITVNDSTLAGIRRGHDTHEYSIAGPPRLYDLKLTKRADRDSVFTGDIIKFTLAIENLGPHPAFNVSLRDSLSEFLNVREEVTASERILAWQFDELPPQQTMQVSYTAVVSSALTDSTKELLNVARLRADCDSDLSNDSTGLRLTVFKRKNYDLAIVKTADRDTVTGGETISYTITVSNLGPNTAFNIGVRDTLPDFLSPIHSAVADGNVLFWQIDSLTTEQSRDISYQARVDSVLPKPPPHLTNISRVFAQNDTNATNNVDRFTVVTTLRPRPPKPVDLAIQKQADKDSVNAGETITYTLTITNLGPNDASTFQITDIVPEFMTPIDVDTSQGKIIEWRVDSLAAFESLSLVYQALVQNPLPRSPVELINLSRIWADADTNIANNTARDTVIARNGMLAPPGNYDLSIQKTADRDTITAGGKITYNLIIRNLGPNPAFAITVRDTLPDFVTAIAPDSLSGNALFWQIDALAAEQNTTITYQARVESPLPQSPLELINSSRVFAANDTNSANNFATVTIVASNLPPPPARNYDLSIQKSANLDSVTAGESITYTLVVRNLGPNTAFNVTVRDTLPEFLTPVDLDFAPGNVLSWQLDSLAASQSQTFVYQAQVVNPLPFSPVELINVSRVFAANDTNSANNSARARVTAENQAEAACADLAVFVTIDKDSVKVGEVFVYSLRISNFSQETAYNIVLQVTIPEFVTPLDFESRAGNDLFWRLDSLLGGEETTIHFRGKLERTPPSNQVRLVNTARVSSDCDRDESNNIAQTFVIVVAIFEDCNVFHLDVNVFQPERGQPLGINFELSESRAIQLDVYDLTGYHIAKIAEATFSAGVNRFEWNGAINGQKVGSGVYVISLRSSNLLCWKKVIIAR